MGIIAYLVLFPLCIAAVLLLIKNDKVRTPIVIVAAVAIAAGSIVAAVQFLGSGSSYFSNVFGAQEAIGYILFAVDMALAAYIIVKGVKHRKPLAVVLAIVQGLAIIVLELGFAHGVNVSNYLMVDSLAIMMVLIIGVIGTGICVYALGYMRDYQAHEPEGEKDRRPIFFSLMFAFLSAMFLLVFSNNLMWLLTAWEVTTVCSFALIGYSRTPEAIANSFRQIWMNLIGGIAFTAGIFMTIIFSGTIELDSLVAVAQSNPIMVLPVALLAVAGLTKGAQMPFHSWLLGAMVAPTPTSALLHSSTMVKAGMFLLIKLSPAFGFNAAGITVMLVGGVSFLLASFMAISQSNAKRVLAYSTIANLGLIAACAGTGTAEGAWAAIFLTIFHACAKSLLFLCVGTAEHHIGSRNIEDMDLLFERMPALARFMMFGIMVMFIAPFGMLISKWAALQAFVDAGNLVLVMILAFGSAATFFFWGKWLGKLTAGAGNEENIEGTIWKSEWVSIGLMATLAAVACVTFPLLSDWLVAPYVASLFGSATAATALSSQNLILMAVIAAAVIIMIVGLPRYNPDRQDKPYMSGLTVDGPDRTFKNSFSQPMKASQSNWYLEGIFGEARLDKVAIWSGIILLVAGVIWALVVMFMNMGGVL